MAKCIQFFKSPSYCYKHFKCRCAVCRAWKKRVDTEPNKEKAREVSRLWRLNNLDRSRFNAKRYQKENPNQVFKWQLKKYGLTLEQYQALELRANNKCEICGELNLCKTKTRLSIDHSAKTKKVRGLLCNSCNLGIGHLKHSLNLLDKAKKYLQENGDVYV